MNSSNNFNNWNFGYIKSKIMPRATKELDKMHEVVVVLDCSVVGPQKWKFWVSEAPNAKSKGSPGSTAANNDPSS